MDEEKKINIVIEDYLSEQQIRKITNRFEGGFDVPKILVEKKSEYDKKKALSYLAINDFYSHRLELDELLMLLSFIDKERSQTEASNIPLVGKVSAKKLVGKLVRDGYLIKGLKIKVNEQLFDYLEKVPVETLHEIEKIGEDVKPVLEGSINEITMDEMTNEEKIKYVYENFSPPKGDVRTIFMNQTGWDAFLESPEKTHELLISTLEDGFDSQYDDIKAKINEEEKKPTMEKYIKEYIRRVYVDMTWKVKISEFGMTVDYTRLRDMLKKDPKEDLFLEESVTFDGFFYGKAATLVQLASGYGIRGMTTEKVSIFMAKIGKHEQETHKTREELVIKFKEYLK